jgi:hypothetical protein
MEQPLAEDHGSGSIFRVTRSGILTVIADRANPAADLVVGNDGLLRHDWAGGPFGWEHFSG